MFLVYTEEDNEYTPFNSLREAEAHAQELAEDGYESLIFSHIRTVEARLDLSDIPHSFARAMFGGSLPASMGRDYV